MTRSPAARRRHGSWLQLRRRRRLHGAWVAGAFSQQSRRRCARRAQLRNLQVSAIFQLLLPIQHGLALYVEGFRFLQQFNSALPLSCNTNVIRRKEKGHQWEITGVNNPLSGRKHRFQTRYLIEPRATVGPHIIAKFMKTGFSLEYQFPIGSLISNIYARLIKCPGRITFHTGTCMRFASAYSKLNFLLTNKYLNILWKFLYHFSNSLSLIFFYTYFSAAIQSKKMKQWLRKSDKK